MKAVRKDGALTVLEFLVIRGHAYTIIGSGDLQKWTPVSFRLSTDSTGSLLSQVQAADTKVLQVLVDPRDGAETNVV